jgi:acetate kinase
MKENLILVINAGSSSLKFKLFNERLRERAEGLVEKIGWAGSFISYKINGHEYKDELKVSGHDEAMTIAMDVLKKENIDLSLIKKVGHRVVHGGEKFIKPTLITKENLKQLEDYNKLAPLHNPHNLVGIKACLKLLPQAKNYAVFDTAFHATMPDFAYLYAVPTEIYKKYNVRRYGFHGISHAYVSSVAAKKLHKSKPNLITCHLGSGCSICAIRNGASVDTSMGLTPLEGLMMSSRSGDIDPGAIFYLQREGLSLSEVDRLLNFESGLKGVSGMRDMRDILIASGYKITGYKSLIKFTKENKYLAKLALKMFVYRIRKYIGAYYAVLGKVDAVVFTAGIGERNKDIRDLITAKLPFKTRILTIPTNEELMIARSVIGCR